MQGQQDYSPALFLYTDMDGLIPDDHMLRHIDACLDLSFIRELSASLYTAGKGRPSIDPELYLRMQIIRYLYNIPSERALCEQIHYNLAYRWFCRLSLTDSVPHHSSLSRIRTRMGEAIAGQCFDHIVQLCISKNLADGEEVMTDGSLIQANASLDSMEPIGEEAEQSAQTLLISGKPKRTISNKTHVSCTDPDASLAMKNGTQRTLKYKIHDTIDTKHRIILDRKVTTGARHESQEHVSQLDSIMARFDLTIATAIADRGCGGIHNIILLREKGIKTIIPLFSSRSGKAAFQHEENFTYQEDEDRYQCSAGHFLTPYPTQQKDTIIYHSKKADCQRCTQQQTCTAKFKKAKAVRYIYRNVHQSLYEEITHDMKQPKFITKMHERMWKIEGIFAEAKAQHGMNRAKYRSLPKVQIQAYFTAIVQNIKRFIAYLCLIYNVQFRVIICINHCHKTANT
jgi:transposase